MKGLTLQNIAAVTGGTYCGTTAQAGIEVQSVTTDSRQAAPGCLFVAIKGERVDGHKFIPQVIAAGAAAVLSEHDLGQQPYPYVVVPSSLVAVQRIAELYRQQLGLPVVGIVGSVGKTSTKEMTCSVLSQRYSVLKTEGNFNNELGVPLTIFRLRPEHQIAVLEMGISHFGEMHRLAQIARPDTVIMTNIGQAHLENLKSRDGILKAKSEVFDFLKPDAHIIVNGDDDKLSTIGQVRGIKPVRFGFGPECDVWASDVEDLGLKGSRCTVHTPQGHFAVTVGQPGRHSVLNALAGAAVGLTYGLTLDEIKRGIEASKTIAGRFNIITTPRYTVIDDCYNASPASMKASLQVLQCATGRRVAILGDMAELGANELEMHASVGKCAAQLGIDLLLCAGPLSKALTDAAAESNPKLLVRHFATRDLLLIFLPQLLRQGDTILVKASHCMGFADVVAALTRQ